MRGNSAKSLVNKPFGLGKRVGDTVAVDLPGSKIGVVEELEYTYKRGSRIMWALVKIKEQQTWYPCSLLFVIPKEWGTSGVRT